MTEPAPTWNDEDIEGQEFEDIEEEDPDDLEELGDPDEVEVVIPEAGFFDEPEDFDDGSGAPR